MSLTADEKRGLTRAIESDDSETIVAILEPRVQEKSITDAQALLCGVTLLMPPQVDEEAASHIFSGLYESSRKFDAAVWDAYRFAVLRPGGDESFEDILQQYPHSAVTAHVLSMVYSTRGDRSTSLSLNQRSRMMRPFPFNLSSALTDDPGLTKEERSDIWSMMSDLIVDRSVEYRRSSRTVEGALQGYWDNLILGTRITDVLWRDYQERFGC